MTYRKKQKESRAILNQILRKSGYNVKTQKRKSNKKVISTKEMMEYAMITIGFPLESNTKKQIATDPLIRKSKKELGALRGQFYLPLELAPPLNKFAEMPNWLRHKLKRQTLQIMFTQYGGRARSPISGRPVVYTVRFSSKKPDASCGWHKIAIDRLSIKHQGLGLLIDDNPDYLELHETWRKAPPGSGFIYLEVWSGNEYQIY